MKQPPLARYQGQLRPWMPLICAMALCGQGPAAIARLLYAVGARSANTTDWLVIRRRQFRELQAKYLRHRLWLASCGLDDDDAVVGTRRAMDQIKQDIDRYLARRSGPEECDVIEASVAVLLKKWREHRFAKWRYDLDQQFQKWMPLRPKQHPDAMRVERFGGGIWTPEKNWQEARKVRSEGEEGQQP